MAGGGEDEGDFSDAGKFEGGMAVEEEEGGVEGGWAGFRAEAEGADVVEAFFCHAAPLSAAVVGLGRGRHE